MTKQILKVLQAILLAALTSALSACVTINGEPDEPEEEVGRDLLTPKYSAEAALFTITDAEADIKSIELTESGHFIVASEEVSMAKTASRGGGSGTSFGKFSKTGDGQYELDGFGLMKISQETQSVVVVTIARLSGISVSYRARREMSNNSPNTSLMCRTWEMAKIMMRRYIDNELVAQREMTIRQYQEMYGDSSTFPKYVIFTKTGSYYGVYANNNIAVSKWTWENDEEGLLNVYNLYDESESSLVQVSFKGGYMLWTDAVTGPYHGYEYSSDSTETIETIMYLGEVKD